MEAVDISIRVETSAALRSSAPATRVRPPSPSLDEQLAAQARATAFNRSLVDRQGLQVGHLERRVASIEAALPPVPAPPLQKVEEYSFSPAALLASRSGYDVILFPDVPNAPPVGSPGNLDRHGSHLDVVRPSAPYPPLLVPVPPEASLAHLVSAREAVLERRLLEKEEQNLRLVCLLSQRAEADSSFLLRDSDYFLPVGRPRDPGSARAERSVLHRREDRSSSPTQRAVRRRTVEHHHDPRKRRGDQRAFSPERRHDCAPRAPLPNLGAGPSGGPALCRLQDKLRRPASSAQSAARQFPLGRLSADSPTAVGHTRPARRHGCTSVADVRRRRAVAFSCRDRPLVQYVEQLEKRLSQVFPEFFDGSAAARLRPRPDELNHRGLSLADGYRPAKGTPLAFYFGQVALDSPGGDNVPALDSFRRKARVWCPSVDAGPACRMPNSRIVNAAPCNHSCHGATACLRRPPALYGCALLCAVA